MKNKRKIKLIAFDLDGVLVDGRGSWTELHYALGTEKFSKINEALFYSGKITFDEWAKRDVALWHGIEIQRIEKIFSKTKLMKGATETLKILKERGYKLAIVSGGLKILADIIAKKFKIDFVAANEFIVDDGKVAGIKNIIDMNGKGTALEKIAKEANILAEECAAVGDFFNDIPMFKFAGFSIAFNPKIPEIEKIADVVIKEKDLRLILNYF
ncbi:MAG: HAD family phosphatase [Candidatus Altiarchaeota archaeon]